MNIRFEWNTGKAVANARKHSVTFETATQVFFDPYALLEQDRMEGGEHRWRTTGSVGGFTLIVVAHTLRNDGDIEVIRIISARRAERAERQRYEEQAG